MDVYAAILVYLLMSSQKEKGLDNVNPKASAILVGHLENFRNIMKTGNATLGVPILDPYEIEHLEKTFNFSDGLLKGVGQLNNLSLTGLSGFEIEETDSSFFEKKLSFSLKWPLIEEKSLYDINALVTYLKKSIQIFGTGELQQNVEDLRLETVAHFRFKHLKLKIESLDSKIYLGNYTFHITGLFNNEDISRTASSFITEFVKQMVEENQQVFIEIIHEKIISIANDFLSKLSIKDLLALLG